jgi:hypothetical protein
MTTAWMLTSPWPKPHFYEVWRFLREMRDRGLDTQHVNPEMFNVVGDNVYMNGLTYEMRPASGIIITISKYEQQ